MTVANDSVAKGTELPGALLPGYPARPGRVRGRAGDFNVIHWSDRAARAEGLPDVTHGMYTMAQAWKFVTEWAGDPGAVTDFGVNFSAMVPVPDATRGARPSRSAARCSTSSAKTR